MRQHILICTLALLLTLLAGCSKSEGEGGSSPAVTASGVGFPVGNDRLGEGAERPNGDLSRIREIKEKEQADLADRQASEAEWAQKVKEGGSKPLRTFSY